MASVSFWRMMVGGYSGGVEARPRRAPMQQTARDCDQGFGRNPCRFVRHRRGAAFGWHLSLLKGVVATLRSLSTVSGETLGPMLVRATAWRSFLKVLLDTRRFGARSVVVLRRRWRNGCGASSFSRFAYVSIIFLLFFFFCGCMFASAQHCKSVGCIGCLLY